MRSAAPQGTDRLSRVWAAWLRSTSDAHRCLLPDSRATAAEVGPARATTGPRRDPARHPAVLAHDRTQVAATLMSEWVSPVRMPGPKCNGCERDLALGHAGCSRYLRRRRRAAARRTAAHRARQYRV